MNLIRRRKKQPMGVRESSVIRSPSHLRWTRGLCCLIEGRAGHVCEGRMEAHHVREGSNGGMGLKCDDSEVVPLCALAHRTGHDIGWITFQQRYSVNLQAAAAECWAKSPHRLKHTRNQDTRA
jgi:hypothetical protein